MATQSWERALLKSLRVPVTRQNIKFLQSWQRWEGGHTKNDATYNWLNTTRNTPGAVRSINEVGVKAYRDFRSGIQALNQTLNNGRYGDILDALKAGNPYGSDLSSGLSTWVSGSPTGNLKYAAKVMGTKVSSPKPAGAGRGVVAALPTGIDLDPLKIAFSDDPEFLAILEMLPDRVPADEAWAPKKPPTKGQIKGGVFVPPIRQQGTHVTDGLDWNDGLKTARDYIMAAGTPVGAPEGGQIVKWGSAQGGEALYFLADSGRYYWLGHIDQRLPVGTHVKRGQQIAVISSDHPTPHLHIDRKR